MEFLLLWWDELDDLAALGRHVSRAIIGELASIGMPLRAWGVALSGWWRPPERNPLAAEDFIR